jgi:glycosyltransferase involved in cell wall biosynthesis
VKLETRTRGYEKNPIAQRTTGPAVAFGEFSGKHGLGRAAAYDVEQLRAHHSSLTLVDIGPFLKGRTPQPIAFAATPENVYFLCQPDTYRTVFGLIAPGDIAHAWRLGRWVWETPLFPEDWRPAENLLHEVWAPSEFCAETFRRALSIPVQVVPHAVAVPMGTCIDMRARLGFTSDQFLGLSIMDIQSCPERKNPWAHVRAWKRAFSGDPAFHLMMKLRVGKRTRVVLDELRELIGSDRNITLMTEDLSDEEISALQRSANLYLSLHRSEGFGLNIYEALLLGKTVIATDWSANVEYGRKFPNYVPIPPRFVPYRDWTAHYAAGRFVWADTVS